MQAAQGATLIQHESVQFFSEEGFYATSNWKEVTKTGNKSDLHHYEKSVKDFYARLFQENMQDHSFRDVLYTVLLLETDKLFQSNFHFGGTLYFFQNNFTNYSF